MTEESKPAATVETKIFHGPYAQHRAEMNYNYFPRYPPDRQQTQDQILDRAMATLPTNQTQPRAVFTCGTYGAGKGHVLRYMHRMGHLDLGQYLLIDPDQLRQQLPELAQFMKEDPTTAGAKTHLEATFLAMLVEKVALARKVSYIVDGSLHNTVFYERWFGHLHDCGYHITIVRVHTDLKVAQERCAERAQRTGRIIAPELVANVHEKVAVSYPILAKCVDTCLEYDNNGSGGDGILLHPLG